MKNFKRNILRQEWCAGQISLYNKVLDKYGTEFNGGTKD